jgi:hypothetical protein
MWITAEIEAVRSALRSIFPITQACSQVKWANVKDFSSCARSLRLLGGEGSVLSMLRDLDWDNDGCERALEAGKEEDM